MAAREGESSLESTDSLDRKSDQKRRKSMQPTISASVTIATKEIDHLRATEVQRGIGRGEYRPKKQRIGGHCYRL